MKYKLALTALVLTVILCSQPEPPERVGPLPQGGFLLANGWRIQPTGTQVMLDTFPMSSLLSPDKRYLLVLNGGFKLPTIIVYDLQKNAEVSRASAPDLWLGLAFSHDGKSVYAGGGSTAAVHEFSFSPEGALKLTRSLPVVPEAERTVKDFVGDVAVSPDGRLIYAAVIHQDRVAVINPQSGRLVANIKTGRRPYRLLFHPDGKSFFVSSWADGTVYQYEAENGRPVNYVRLGMHTTDMLLAKDRLFVAAANTNKVYVVGVSAGKELQQIETINVSMTPRQPAGMTPSALALNADDTQLFVVCSDANVVAGVNIAEQQSRLLGFVPVGWYPTAARVLPDGRLVVLNGRGARSYPNPKGPNPTKHVTLSHLGERDDDYVAQMQLGSASFIDPIAPEQWGDYTRAARRYSAYSDDKLENVENPKLPIKHVIYIVKENRTYDQVLGDLKPGNGDPSLVLFHENVAPNHHKLAREFVTFDNFYVNADVSADGHNWSSSAIANDYVQKMWPNSYAKRRKLYDYEGGEPASAPPAGYLWTNAAQAHLTMRNYGWWVANKPAAQAKEGDQVLNVRDPILAPVTSRAYRAFDLDYPDVERAKAFIRELQEYDQKGTLPQLIFLRIGNDHTSGIAAGKIAPLSSFADNDYALGMIVEAVSRSKFWPETAIFVLEDDAQNGPDHVDSHRSPAYILSPYTRHGIVDSTMYNTTSMLRTMELILGLRPMTQFDAASRPMWKAFQAKPDTRPYEAEKPRVPLSDRNAAPKKEAAEVHWDFSEADRADDDELNAELWRAIRKTEPPAPVRSFFGQ